MMANPLDMQVGGSHYKIFPIQPVEFSVKNKLGFCEASIVKYICRHDKPTGKGRQDLEKIKHYVDLILELQYPKEEEKEEEVTTGTDFKTGFCSHGYSHWKICPTCSLTE